METLETYGVVGDTGHDNVKGALLSKDKGTERLKISSVMAPGTLDQIQQAHSGTGEDVQLDPRKMSENGEYVYDGPEGSFLIGQAALDQYPDLRSGQESRERYFNGDVAILLKTIAGARSRARKFYGVITAGMPAELYQDPNNRELMRDSIYGTGTHEFSVNGQDFTMYIKTRDDVIILRECSSATRGIALELLEKIYGLHAGIDIGKRTTDIYVVNYTREGKFKASMPMSQGVKVGMEDVMRYINQELSNEFGMAITISEDQFFAIIQALYKTGVKEEVSDTSGYPDIKFAWKPVSKDDLHAWAYQGCSRAADRIWSHLTTIWTGKDNYNGPVGANLQHLTFMGGGAYTIGTLLQRRKELSGGNIPKNPVLRNQYAYERVNQQRLEKYGVKVFYRE